MLHSEFEISSELNGYLGHAQYTQHLVPPYDMDDRDVAYVLCSAHIAVQDSAENAVLDPGHASLRRRVVEPAIRQWPRGPRVVRERENASGHWQAVGRRPDAVRPGTHPERQVCRRSESSPFQYQGLQLPIRLDMNRLDEDATTVQLRARNWHELRLHSQCCERPTSVRRLQRRCTLIAWNILQGIFGDCEADMKGRLHQQSGDEPQKGQG